MVYHHPTCLRRAYRIGKTVYSREHIEVKAEYQIGLGYERCGCIRLSGGRNNIAHTRQEQQGFRRTVGSDDCGILAHGTQHTAQGRG